MPINTHEMEIKSAKIIQKTFKNYKKKEQDKKLNFETKKILFDLTKSVVKQFNPDYVFTSRLAHDSTYVAPEAFKFFRKSFDSMFKKYQCGNCLEVSLFLKWLIDNHPNIPKFIKDSTKVLHVDTGEGSDHVVLGLYLSGADFCDLIIDPWLKFINFNKKEKFRSEFVHSSKKLTGFFGTPEAYKTFLKSHPIPPYILSNPCTFEVYDSITLSHFFNHLAYSSTFASVTKKNNLLPYDFTIKDFTAKPIMGMSMMVLGGFIAVVGLSAIAIAFTVLNAATLGIPGLVLAAVGATATLSGLGLFAFGNYKRVSEKNIIANACLATGC